MSDLTVSSYVTVRRGCPMRFRVNGGDDVEFSFGDLRTPFEFVFDTEALRSYLAIGAEALQELDAHQAGDKEVAP